MPYQPNIPTGLVNFDQDYLNLQGNFQQLNITYGVDHVPFSDTSGIPPGPTNITGMHKSIHMVPVSTTVSNPPNNQPVVSPVADSGFGQIWNATTNDGINIDQTLYFLTGGNRLIQLTRNIAPKTTNNSNQNGYTYLPGGILIQWGFVPGTHSGGSHRLNAGDTFSVLFATNNIKFPSKCLTMWTALNYDSASPNTTPASTSSGTISINQSNFTNLGFTWLYTGNSNAFTGFTWYALGL